MSSGYDFGQLYGQADNSNILYPENTPLDAICTKSEWGRTKDGTKGQWAIEFRTSTGENAGRMPVPFPMSVSADNPRSLGIMFRHLAALGIPVPDPQDPNKVVNGQVPFWMMGWSPEQVAQSMLNRPVTIFIKHDEYEGVTRNKIRDVRPPRPGAPTDWPRPQMQAPVAPPAYGGQTYPAAPAPGYPPQQPYGQQMAPQPWQAQQPPAAPQPPQGPAQPPWAAPQGPAYPVQPGQQYQATAQYPPQPQFPGGEPPAVPGAGGGAEFTPGGASYQPGISQQPPVPPWAQQPQQAPPQQPGYPQQGQPPQPVPPQPPWVQQAQQPPQNGYPGQPQPQGPQPGQQPGDQPPVPPWMQ